MLKSRLQIQFFPSAILCLTFLFLTFASIPSSVYSAESREYLPGRLLVNFSPDIGEIQDCSSPNSVIALHSRSLDLLFEQYHVRALTRVCPGELLVKFRTPPDLFHFAVLRFPRDVDVLQAAADFRAHPLVRSADPDYVLPYCEVEPNDPYWESQWDKRFMDCPLAWEFSTGSRETVVAAIDMGIDWQLEDFRENLWVNAGEDLDGDGITGFADDSPGDPDDVNGIDDDDNGYVDDFLGWDFINLMPGDCMPGEDCDGTQDNNPFSMNSHGTQMYSIPGAVGNNNTGFAGECWTVSMMGIRAGYASDLGGGIHTSAAIEAIIYAGAMGADVINMSFSIPLVTGPWEEAINAAYNQGSIFCAAAANEADTTRQYPAALANVVAIGSIDPDTTVSSFSSYGSWVDLYVPGVDILTYQNSGLGMTPMTGSSPATANATGAFALLRSIWPDLSNQEITDRMLIHALSIVDQNPDFDPSYLGWGTIDFEGVLSAYLPYPEIAHFVVEDIQGGDGDERLEAGEWGYFVFGIVNSGQWQIANDVVITVTTDDPSLTLTNNVLIFDHIMPGQMVSNPSNPTRVDVSPDVENAHTANIQFEINASGFRFYRTVVVRVGRPPTLLVIDDNDSGYGSYYYDAMAELLTENRFDSVTVYSSSLDMPGFNEYEHVVWVCGNEEENTITTEDQTLLASYLDGGGNLLIAGQNIDEDLADEAFYSSYLHAQSEGLAGNTQLSGVEGDVIADGTSLLLIGGGCAGNGAVSPSQITPVGGAAGIYEYSQGGYGAIRYEGDYRVVYFSCALEAACGMVNTTHYVDVLRRILEYFGEPIIQHSHGIASGFPTSVVLHQNYPNPFNPETNLSFDLRTKGHVSLKVYNTIGQTVASLIDRTMSPGRHSVTFNGSSLPTGIYLYRLQANGTTAERKMMLVK